MDKYAELEGTMSDETTQCWMRDLFTTNMDIFFKAFFPQIYQKCTNSFTQISPKYFNHFTDQLHEGVNIGVRTTKDEEDIIFFIHVLLPNMPTNDLNERIQNTKITIENHFLHPVIPIIVALEANTKTTEIIDTSEMLSVHILKSEIENYLQDGNIVALALLYKYIFTENERYLYSFDIFRKVVQMQANLKERNSFYQFFLT